MHVERLPLTRNIICEDSRHTVYYSKVRPMKSLCRLLLSGLSLLCIVLVMALTTPSAFAAELSHAPDDARVYIIAPQDGDSVSQEFTVKFGLSGMGIAPAGYDKEGTGHHHLLIDIDELPPLTEPLAATSQIKHFGGGQTEAQLSLAPGEHTLQLLLGNYTHIPHDNPVLSDKISITVE